MAEKSLANPVAGPGSTLPPRTGVGIREAVTVEREGGEEGTEEKRAGLRRVAEVAGGSWKREAEGAGPETDVGRKKESAAWPDADESEEVEREGGIAPLLPLPTTTGRDRGGR